MLNLVKLCLTINPSILYLYTTEFIYAIVQILFSVQVFLDNDQVIPCLPPGSCCLYVVVILTDIGKKVKHKTRENVKPE